MLCHSASLHFTYSLTSSDDQRPFQVARSERSFPHLVMLHLRGANSSMGANFGRLSLAAQFYLLRQLKMSMFTTGDHLIHTHNSKIVGKDSSEMGPRIMLLSTLEILQKKNRKMRLKLIKMCSTQPSAITSSLQ